MKKYTFIFLIAFSLILRSESFGKGYQTNLITESQSKYILEVVFDKPDFVDSGNHFYLRWDGCSYSLDENGAYLPFVSELLNLPVSEDVGVEIIDVERENTRSAGYLIKEKKGVKPSEISVKYQGLYKKYPLHSLHIFPVTVSAEKLTYLKKIKIALNFNKPFNKNNASFHSAKSPNAGFLEKNLVNTKNNLYQLNHISNPLNGLQSEIETHVALKGQHIYKISVNKTGLYKITYQDLEEVDFPLDQINPKKLKLLNRNKEVPIYFPGAKDDQFGTSDYFEFWGERNEKTFLHQYPDLYDDPFTETNVYWLYESNDNGIRLVEENGSLIKTTPGTYIVPIAYEEKLHFEQNGYRETFGHSSSNINQLSHESDHWFWDNGILAAESKSYPFHLPWPFDFGSTVYVNAAFRGRSADPAALGHQVMLWLNEQPVGEVLPEDRWKDQQLRFIGNETGISQSSLLNGENELRIDMRQQEVVDNVLLNWFDVRYQRLYRADNDFLKFRVQKNLPQTMTPQFEVDGFSDENIDVYKLGISKILGSSIHFYEANDHFKSYRVVFQDEVYHSDIEYVALTQNQKQSPLKIEPYEYWKDGNSAITLLDKTNEANYLIITHELFEFNAGRLKEMKVADGFLAEYVTVEQIYDVFNYGVKSPIAIKNFIQYVYTNWSQNSPLKYVVFLGDASYDHYERKGKDTDPVPTLLFDTDTYGSASADFHYALLSGDDYIPDISVARIPGATNTEINHYLDKITNYHNASDISQWRNRALMISGNDAGEANLEYVTEKPVFRAQNSRLMSRQLPKKMFLNRLNTVKDEAVEGYDPNFGGTIDLIDYFDQGIAFVNFFGHGGGAIWADVQLLNQDDVDRMNNGPRFPFVSSNTCFTGAFENPGKKSLGEKLLLSENKGAIAFLGSSGVGWKYNDFALSWSLPEFLWQDDISFGEAVDLMKIKYLIDNSYYFEDRSVGAYEYYRLYPSMISQYNLLGDPSLKLQKTNHHLLITANNMNPHAGAVVQFSIKGQHGNGSGSIIVYDEQNNILAEDFITLASGETQWTYTFPEKLAEGSIFVRAYASDGSTDAAGFLELAVKKAVIRRLRFSPENPEVEQKISVQFEAFSKEPINEIRLQSFTEVVERNKTYFDYKIPMIALNDSSFVTADSIPAFENSGEKYFDIYVRSADTVENVYQWNRVNIIDNRPDLSIDPASFAYTGTDRVQLSVNLTNASLQTINHIEIAIYDSSGILSGIPIQEQEVSLNSEEEKNIIFDLPNLSYSSKKQFKVLVDPNNKIDERNEANNEVEQYLETNHLFVEKEIGTSLDNVDNDTLLLKNRWALHIDEQTLPHSGVIFFNEINIADPIFNSDQEKLEYKYLDKKQDTVGFEIQFKNITEENRDFEAYLSVRVDTAMAMWQDTTRVYFHRYDENLNKWIKRSGALTGNIFHTKINQDGIYAIFKNTYTSKPLIEITANGRPLRDKMYLTQRPNLGFVLQDQSGVNFKNTFKIEIDGEQMEADVISFPESVNNSKTVSILAVPELEFGSHTLKVQVANVNGETSAKSIEIIVSNEFRFVVYGNFPNPFTDKTHISYEAGGQGLSNLSIKIYTTSGRLIRSEMLDSAAQDNKDDLYEPDYHEIVWDGTDDDGNEVANGVYFLIISAKSEGKTIAHTVKMAKLK
jgi:hypothetical protein